MSQLLELAELPESDRVAEMDVRRGGIEPLLHAQRGPGRDRALELSNELGFGNQLHDAGSDHAELAVDLGLMDGSAHGARTVASSARPGKPRGTKGLIPPGAAPSVPEGGFATVKGIRS
jgi:hypothetical protein